MIYSIKHRRGSPHNVGAKSKREAFAHVTTVDPFMHPKAQRNLVELIFARTNEGPALSATIHVGKRATIRSSACSNSLSFHRKKEKRKGKSSFPPSALRTPVLLAPETTHTRLCLLYTSDAADD